jgi:hypothetical protein
MKLSVFAERVKTQEKSQRAIGSNKTQQPSPAEKAKEAADTAAAGRRGKGPAAQLGAARAGIRQPGKPGFNFLDLLQYNYAR